MEGIEGGLGVDHQEQAGHEFCFRPAQWCAGSKKVCGNATEKSTVRKTNLANCTFGSNREIKVKDQGVPSRGIEERFLDFAFRRVRRSERGRKNVGLLSSE